MALVRMIGLEIANLQGLVSSATTPERRAEIADDLRFMAETGARIIGAGEDMILNCTTDEPVEFEASAHECAWENRHSPEAFEAVLKIIAGTESKVSLTHGQGGVITFERLDLGASRG